MDQNPESRDYLYLATVGEVLEITAELIERAREAQGDIPLGAYLKMASRSLRCALEMYGEHLAQNRSELNDTV